MYCKCGTTDRNQCRIKHRISCRKEWPIAQWRHQKIALFFPSENLKTMVPVPVKVDRYWHHCFQVLLKSEKENFAVKCLITEFTSSLTLTIMNKSTTTSTRSLPSNWPIHRRCELTQSRNSYTWMGPKHDGKHLEACHSSQFPDRTNSIHRWISQYGRRVSDWFSNRKALMQQNTKYQISRWNTQAHEIGQGKWFT